MHLKTRIIAVILCVAMVLATIFAGQNGSIEQTEETYDYNDSLVIWYTDEALTDYLNAMAVEYHEETGVRVIPKLQSGSDYIESIYAASIDGTGAPDLYIITNDSLEKAYLSGCAVAIDDKSGEVSDRNFSQAALNAVRYEDSMIAYPFYFETCALVYNRTYLQQLAYSQLQAEDAEAAEAEASGEDAEAEADSEATEEASDDSSSDESSTEASTETSTETEEETTEVSLDESLDSETLDRVEDRIGQILPATFDDLLTFADEYDAPEGMESVFTWDVRDIFYNYYFIGNYINVGGDYGDDTDTVDIYNINSIEAMQVFQDMNQFFSFEYEDLTYDDVIEQMLEGKLLYTTATTDVVKTLENAANDEECQYTFGVARIPELNSDMNTRNLSVTDCLVINGYSNKRDDANSFARFLSVNHAADLFEKTGKIASYINANYEDDNIDVFLQEYADSASLPKLMATSNFWLKLETAFADVWGGADVSSNLKTLSEETKEQITGTLVEEEYIEAPEEETEETEYLDEEALKEAAKQEE